jgi:hypothetical protein
MTATAPGTINAPTPARGIPPSEIVRRVEQRVAMQQGIPSASQRMMSVPIAPRGQGLVRVRAQWDPQLTGMSIVQPSRLPRELILDEVDFKDIVQTPQFFFPPGPTNPIEGGIPISQKMVQFVPVDRNQQSIAAYMQQNNPQYVQQIYQPQWAMQSIASGKARQPRDSKGRYESLSRSMEKLEVKESHTKAKSTTHSVRAARHTKAKADLDSLLKTHKTIY